MQSNPQSASFEIRRESCGLFYLKQLCLGGANESKSYSVVGRSNGTIVFDDEGGLGGGGPNEITLCHGQTAIDTLYITFNSNPQFMNIYRIKNLEIELPPTPPGGLRVSAD